MADQDAPDRLAKAVTVENRRCECGARLVWTAVWQGACCVICSRRDAEVEIETLTQAHATLTAEVSRLRDAAEMLWVVLANVSGGDWEKQTPEWQEAAARWRDNYYRVAQRPDSLGRIEAPVGDDRRH